MAHLSHVHNSGLGFALLSHEEMCRKSLVFKYEAMLTDPVHPLRHPIQSTLLILDIGCTPFSVVSEFESVDPKERRADVDFFHRVCMCADKIRADKITGDRSVRHT